jgi:ankyrin repeat protein
MSYFGAPPQQIPQQQQEPHSLASPRQSSNDDNITTLNVAVVNDRPDIAKSLLENGANVNERNATGFTPLHLAIVRNNPDMVSLLLENGAELNVQNPVGDTPLHIANRKNPVISKLLLAKGADMNSTNRFGDTPLYINPGLARLNREVQAEQAEQAEQNFEVRKPLIQLSQGTDTSSSPRTRYLQNEFVARDISSYLDRNTKGGKYKRKSRKYRKSRKSKRSRKSRKYRR